MKLLTREEIMAIPRLRKSGKSAYDIAKDYGVHYQTIVRWSKRLRDAGHEVPISGPGRKKIEL